MTAPALHADRLCAAAAVTLAPRRRSRRLGAIAEFVLTAIGVGVGGFVLGFGLAATLIEQRARTFPVEHETPALHLTPTLRAMLERIAAHSGSQLMLTITASGRGEETKLNKLRGAGYVVKCDHPHVKEPGDWPAEALAITAAGRDALAKSGGWR